MPYMSQLELFVEFHPPAKLGESGLEIRRRISGKWADFKNLVGMCVACMHWRP